jgi:hypothetical protein
MTKIFLKTFGMKVIIVQCLFMAACASLVANNSFNEVRPQESQERATAAFDNWCYGEGLGVGLVNVGAVVVFPPYAAYVLGNAIIDYSGYEPLHVTALLPEKPREHYNAAYEAVTGAPGRVTAALAGKEFRSKEVQNIRSKQPI